MGLDLERDDSAEVTTETRMIVSNAVYNLLIPRGVLRMSDFDSGEPVRLAGSLDIFYLRQSSGASLETGPSSLHLC